MNGLNFPLFLIVGPRRTGTTLLNSVCCSDPAANPLVAEAQILTRLIESYRWGRVHYNLFGKSYFDSPDAYRSYFAGVAESFVQHAQRRFAAATLVLKNPEFSLVIDDVRALLPSAKIIATVRDPRDQVVSEWETRQRQLGAAGNPSGERDIAALAAQFNAYSDPLLHAADAAPDRFLFVRFEDLVLRTETALQQLRSFTGLTLANFRRDADWARVHVDWKDYQGVPAITPQYGHKVDETRVGRFAAELSTAECETVARVCGPLMRRFGYQ